MKAFDLWIEGIAWLLISPCLVAFLLFADALAGGKALSLPLFWRDLTTLNPDLFGRALLWLIMLLPIAWLVRLIAAWRRMRAQSQDR